MTLSTPLDEERETKLLPCPFCGGDSPMLGKLLRDGCQPDEIEAYAHTVRCHACAAEGGWAKSESGARRWWNRRAALPSAACGYCHLSDFSEAGDYKHDSPAFGHLHLHRGCRNEIAAASRASRSSGEPSAIPEEPATLTKERLAEIRASIEGLPSAGDWYPDATCDDDEMVVRFEHEEDDDDNPDNPGRVVAVIPIVGEGGEDAADRHARFIASAPAVIGELLSHIELPESRSALSGGIPRSLSERSPGFESRCEKTLNEGRHVCLLAKNHDGDCRPMVNAPWPPRSLSEEPGVWVVLDGEGLPEAVYCREDTAREYADDPNENKAGEGPFTVARFVRAASCVRFDGKPDVRDADGLISGDPMVASPELAMLREVATLTREYLDERNRPAVSWDGMPSVQEQKRRRDRIVELLEAVHVPAGIIAAPLPSSERAVSEEDARKMVNRLISAYNDVRSSGEVDAETRGRRGEELVAASDAMVAALRFVVPSPGDKGSER